MVALESRGGVYIFYRPHQSLDLLTPNEYVQQLKAA